VVAGGHPTLSSRCGTWAHREPAPECPVFLAVDQQLGEGAALRVGPELAYPVGAFEVGEHQDVGAS
jgi:hypothetical protein